MATLAKMHQDLASRERKAMRLAKKMYFKLTRQATATRLAGRWAYQVRRDRKTSRWTRWKKNSKRGSSGATTVVKIALPHHG